MVSISLFVGVETYPGKDYSGPGFSPRGLPFIYIVGREPDPVTGGRKKVKKLEVKSSFLVKHNRESMLFKGRKI